MQTSRNRARAFCAVLLAAAVVVPQASADGTPGKTLTPSKTLSERLATLTERVKTHRAAKDIAGLQGDLKAAVQLHADVKDEKALRKKVIALMGGVPRSMKSDSLRVSALTALGETRDPLGAKYIRFYLKQPNAKRAGEILLTAVRVAAQAPDSSLVSPLLKIVTRSKHMGAAAAALKALGHFRAVKTHRTKIFKAVIDSVRKSKPGVKGTMKDPVEGDMYNHAGEETRNRWAALAGVLPKMLAQLTGNDTYGLSAEEWFTMYDDNKRHLNSLFSDEEKSGATSP